MKRVCSIVLCLCMLLTSVAIFSSCGKKNGEIQPSKKTKTVDLAEYAIIYDGDLSSDVRNHVTSVANNIGALTALTYRPQADDSVVPEITEENPVVKEILIGSTDREESAKALNSVGDLGWIIQVFEKTGKIVIVGKTPYLTRVALSYFNDTFVANEEALKGTTLTLNEKVIVKKMTALTLTTGEGADLMGDYTFVYDGKLDDDPASEFGTESGTKTVDYPVTARDEMRAAMASFYKLRETAFNTGKDTADVVEKEVLIGNQNRPEMKEELATLDADEYSLSIKNGKIIVAAWNDTALTAAVTLYKAMLKDSTVVDKEGNDVLMLPDNCRIKLSLSDTNVSAWITEFPRPDTENLSLVTTQDVGDGAHLYVYAGEGATEEAFNAYCKKLEENKFSQYGPSEQMGQNVYRTYISYQNNIAMRVSYIPYSEADAQGIDNFTKSIRIVVAPNDKTVMTDDDYFSSSQAYIKLTDTAITQMKLDYAKGAFGMCYIITLEDGSFIVYDGGGISEGTTDDHIILWQTLEALFKETHEGAAPTSADPIHIRAWVLTHEHTDHFMNFQNFCEKYGPQSNFRLDMLLANFASDSENYNVYNPQSVIQDNIVKLQETVRNGFDYIKVHSGQTFYMVNAKLDILYTHEDTYPQRMVCFNNSSTIIRITLNSTNGKGLTEKSTVGIWLGDAERIASKCVRAMHGADMLKADLVQYAHHGWNGCEKELYDLISPEVVLVPSRRAVYNQQFAADKANSSNWAAQTASYVANALASVKFLAMADTYNTTFWINKNGMQYAVDQLFDPLRPEADFVNRTAATHFYK